MLARDRHSGGRLGIFLLGTYDQVADENLQDLGLQACPATENLLEEPDEEVTHGSADQGAVRGHLGHSRGEVVAMLVAILGEE